MRFALFLLAGLFVPGLFACADDVVDPEPGPVAASVEVVSGDGQEALIQDSLPQPLRVRALDHGGNPVPGVIVQWKSTIGPIEPATTPTNLEGVAETTWWMGRGPGMYEPGLHHATASAEGGARPSVSFDGYARVGPSIADFSFTPTEVDVSTSAATIMVRAHILTDHGIVVHVFVRFRTPSGDRYGTPSPLGLVSGTSRDGVWEGTVTIPQGAEPGPWPLSELIVEGSTRRIIGNASSMEYKGLPSTLLVTAG